MAAAQTKDDEDACVEEERASISSGLPSISEAIELLLRTEDFGGLDPEVFAAAASRVTADVRAQALLDLADRNDPCLAATLDIFGGQAGLFRLDDGAKGVVVSAAAFLQLAAAIARAFDAEDYLTEAQICSIYSPFLSWVEQVGLTEMAKGDAINYFTCLDRPVDAGVRLGLTMASGSVLQTQLDLVERIRGAPTGPHREILVRIVDGLRPTEPLIVILLSEQLRLSTGGALRDPAPPGLVTLIHSLDSHIEQFARGALYASVSDMPDVLSHWAVPGRVPSAAAPWPSPSLDAFLSEVVLRDTSSAFSQHALGIDHDLMQFLIVSAMQIVAEKAQYLSVPSTYTLSIPGLVALHEAFSCHIHTATALPGNVYVLSSCTAALQPLIDSLSSWPLDSSSDPDIAPQLKGAVLARLAAVHLHALERGAEIFFVRSLSLSDYRLPAIHICCVLRRLLPALSEGFASGVIPSTDASFLLSRAGRILGLAKNFSENTPRLHDEAVHALTSSLIALFGTSQEQRLALFRDLGSLTFAAADPESEGGETQTTSVLEFLQASCRDPPSDGEVAGSDVYRTLLGLLEP